MIYFLDSSALARRYLAEPGSARVIELVGRRVEIAVSRLTSAEIASALTRALNRGAIDEPTRARALAQFDRDAAELRVVEVRRRTVERARELIAGSALRAYDAVQLASALQLADGGAGVEFWCADRALGAVAVATGLRATVLG